MDWLDKYQAQVVILSAQIAWSENVETALQSAADGKTQGTSALQGNFIRTTNDVIITRLMT